MPGKTPIRATAVLAAALLTLAGSTSVRAAEEKKDRDATEASAPVFAEIDLGPVDIEGDPVRGVFQLFNTNRENIVLLGAYTSCACATAAIVFPGDTISGPFGIHRPDGWSRVVVPDEEFNVHVQIDPAYHGRDDLGAFAHDVFLLIRKEGEGETSAQVAGTEEATLVRLRLSGEYVTADEG